MSTTPEIQIGMKVTWTEIRKTANGISFTTKTGRVLGRGDMFATVRKQNGRPYMIRIAKLTPIGQPTELTRAIFPEIAQ